MRSNCPSQCSYRKAALMPSAMSWLNEPRQWSIDGETVTAVTEANTDFWRETFYDFIRDYGHCFHQSVTGDFTAAVTIAGDYETLYDQSGLMLRVDECNWLKTGIEFTDGAVHISTVVTRDFSDWSMTPLTSFSGQVAMRLTRHGTALRVQYLDESGTWQLVRLAYLDLPETVQVGMMLCSPQRAGFASCRPPVSSTSRIPSIRSPRLIAPARERTSRRSRRRGRRKAQSRGKVRPGRVGLVRPRPRPSANGQLWAGR